jgi:Surface-adhesin protein E
MRKNIVLKTIVLMVLPIVAACGAKTAEWIELGSSAMGKPYAAPASIKKTGDSATMWVLFDYPSAQKDASGKMVLSDKLHYEYDCKARLYRILASSAHAGNMASGEVIGSTSGPEPWAPVEADSLGETDWNYACGNGTGK